MSREKFLQHRLKTLGVLDEAISAMKSLAAHHFLVCRRSLGAARDYRTEIDSILHQVGLGQQLDHFAPPAVLVITSDLGMCGDYHSRLIRAAEIWLQENKTAQIHCVGRRGRALLEKGKHAPLRYYSAPASVSGFPGLLLHLAQDLITDFVQQRNSSLTVVSARFEGAGHFNTVTTEVLPIRAPLAESQPLLTKYQSYRHVAAVTVREYLYITLYEILLDALASEHGMRMLAAESARQWVEDTSALVERQIAASRREASTQEVLDIVAGSRKSRKQDN